MTAVSSGRTSRLPVKRSISCWSCCHRKAHSSTALSNGPTTVYEPSFETSTPVPHRQECDTCPSRIPVLLQPHPASLRSGLDNSDGKPSSKQVSRIQSVSYVMNWLICAFRIHVRLNCRMRERRVGSKGRWLSVSGGGDIVTEVLSRYHCLTHLIRHAIRTRPQFYAG